jgi:hypothetical protein
MILDDSFPTTCASCHDCWGYRNATLRMTTWSECRWQAADIPCTRWRPQRERVADSSLHRAPPHPTTTRRKKGGAYFLTTTTVVQCMRRSPSSAERIWDAATLFWEGRIAQRRLRSFSTGDGDSASDVRSLTTVGRLFCGPRRSGPPSVASPWTRTAAPSHFTTIALIYRAPVRTGANLWIRLPKSTSPT